MAFDQRDRRMSKASGPWSKPVFSRSDPASGAPAPHAIAGRLFGQTRTLYHVTVQDRYRIATTRNHPFHVIGVGWKHAHALGPGDRIETLDGGSVVVTAVEHECLDAWRLTYNVHVADAATYYIGAVGGPALWVHNGRAAQPMRP